MRTAGTTHREGGVTTGMVESKGREGPLRVSLVKAGKLRPREQQGLKTPDSCSPACNWGSQAQPPLRGHSPLSCKFFREGRGQPARSNRGDAEVRSPEATAGDGSQMGGGASWLPPFCLSVCLSVCRVGSPGDPLSALMLPSISCPRPPLPSACQDERWLCPSPGPRPQARFPLISC